MFFFKKNPLILRKIHSAGKEIFLTFDDGPEPDLTPQILDLLREFHARATFFVIGDRARQHPQLLHRLLAEGHGVLSHSRDHRYGHYFQGQESLRRWLAASLQDLEAQTGRAQKSFRPPAGVLKIGRAHV